MSLLLSALKKASEDEGKGEYAGEDRTDFEHTIKHQTSKYQTSKNQTTAHQKNDNSAHGELKRSIQSASTQTKKRERIHLIILTAAAALLVTAFMLHDHGYSAYTPSTAPLITTTPATEFSNIKQELKNKTAALPVQQTIQQTIQQPIQQEHIKKENIKKISADKQAGKRAQEKQPSPTAPKHKATAPEEHLKRGYSALNEGRVEDAYTHYLNAFKQTPKNRDVLLGLAAVETDLGRWPRALEHYQTLLSLNPNDALAHAGILSLTQNTHPNQLETKLKAIIDASPQPSAMLLSTLGSLYIKMKAWPQAQALFFEAWRESPKDPNIVYNLAITLEYMQQYREALRFYHMAIQNSQNSRPLFDTQRLSLRIVELEAYMSE